MNSLFVDHKDLDKFYKYSASRLRNAVGGEGLSATERQAKLETHVRGLFTSIFDQSVKAEFDGGKEMLENFQSIISDFVTNGGSSDWYQRLLSSIGDQNDPYNHACCEG